MWNPIIRCWLVLNMDELPRGYWFFMLRASPSGFD